MFFKILSAEIFGIIIGLMIGGRGFFCSYWFIALLIVVCIIVGLVVFKMVT